ncbi:MAG: dephospho-CoA kinase [Paludibacteraceae bacterium]|nr:dephospho-CoA kinase [Paludibacteraceae bacterium]
MRIIGLTGGIGSGKSTIARELVRRGYPVYDCDREAKRVITDNPDIRDAIIALLGEKAFDGNTYNTAYVSRRVFADSGLLKQLNAIVHPAVIHDLKALSESDNRHSAILFVESAILHEAGVDRLCEAVIVVEAPEKLRIERTIARDYNGANTAENRNKVCARIQSQYAKMQDIKQEGKPTAVILNDGTLSITEIADEILGIIAEI